MLGRLRVAANRILVGTAIHNGAKFRAARGERRMAMEKPRTVATKPFLWSQAFQCRLLNKRNQYLNYIQDRFALGAWPSPVAKEIHSRI